MVYQTNLTRFPQSSNTGEKITLDDWLKEMYLGLLGKGWTMNDIDDMDLCYYLELLSYRANKECKKQSNDLDDAGL